MPHHSVLHLVLLMLSGVVVPVVLTAEYPQGPAPTLWNEPPPELPSGGGPFDAAATTTGSFSDSTGFPPYTSEYEPEDTTHLPHLDDDGSLGPGAISAIVIAALLGTSVIVALIVITMRKFSAS